MATRTLGIPDYRFLDESGEGGKAARRMEDRCRERSSLEMYEHLIWPLIEGDAPAVLEVGCGTGGLARRMSAKFPRARIIAIDRSDVMVSAAIAFAEEERVNSVTFRRKDVRSDDAFAGGPFDLILSSVMAPYLTDAETVALVRRMRENLRQGGRVAFLEQDLLTDSVNVPDFDLFRRVYARDERTLKRTLALGLRPVLREAGLALDPRRSFLWTDDRYGPYVRELQTRAAEEARVRGRITDEDETRWLSLLNRQADCGDFYYGLVYHLISGRRPS